MRYQSTISDSCLLCSHREWVPFGEHTPSHPSILHKTYSQCTNCGFVQATPMADDEAVNRFYNSPYWHSLSAEFREQKEQTELQRILTNIERYSPGIRVLDAGADNGTLANALRTAGMDVWTCEPNEECEGSLKAIVGEDRHQTCFFEEIALQDTPLDAIVAWHVLEHVTKPHRFMQVAYNLLSTGGIVILGTPNVGALIPVIRRVLNRVRHRDLPPPTSTEHTCLFGKATLKRLAIEHGFTIVYCNAYDDNIHGDHIAPTDPAWKRLLKRIQMCCTNTLNRGGSKLFVVLRKSK